MKFKTAVKKYYYILFLILMILSYLFFCFNILKLDNIENALRLIILSFSLIINIVLVINFFNFRLTNKKKMKIVNLVIIGLLTIIYFVFGFIINKSFSYISKIQKEYIVYETILLANTEKPKNIGILSNENDAEGNILPIKYIEKKKGNYNLLKYENYELLINDIDKLDGFFISRENLNFYSKKVKGFKEIDSYKKRMKNLDYIKKDDSNLEKPFSFLLIGIDSKYEGIKNNSGFNGDALMVVTFNPHNLKTTLFSIPRDTYTNIACTGNDNKINAAAGYGTKCMIKTVEDFIGLGIDYYAKINFKGVVSLVDAVGGITVDVPEPDYPDAYCVDDSDRKGKDICLKPGVGTLNGEEALALTRIRKAFALVDFKRVQNQQLVIEGIVNEIKNIKNVNTLFKVLDSISNNLETNMSTKEILSLYNISKDILDSNYKINIEKSYLSGYGLTINGAYTYQHYKNSLKEIVDMMKINLALSNPELIKKVTFDINDKYEQQVAGKGTYNETKKEVLPNFKDKKIISAKKWLDTRNIKYNINYINASNCVENIIVKQSISKGRLLENIDSIVFDVCEKTFINDEKDIDDSFTNSPEITTKPIIDENQESDISEDDKEKE